MATTTTITKLEPVEKLASEELVAELNDLRRQYYPMMDRDKEITTELKKRLAIGEQVITRILACTGYRNATAGNGSTVESLLRDLATINSH